MKPVSLTGAEREQFLAAPHIGVLGVAGEDGRAPLQTPIWYDYEPGGPVQVMTDPGSRKARLVAAAGRFGLCAQTERHPYAYVTAEGPLVGAEPTTEQTWRRMARRYLAADVAEHYVQAMLASGLESVTFSMRPERWAGVSFARIAAELA